MARVILYIATTLDGYIARTNGGLDWLHPFEKTPEGTPEDHGYGELLASVGTVLMGATTYEWLLSFGGEYPYAAKKSYVFSKRPLPMPPGGSIISAPAVDFVKGLKARETADIWLVGGGKLNHSLIVANLVDELRLFYVPVMLGEGTRLNAGREWLSHWQLQDVKRFNTGLIELRYTRKDA